MANNVTIVPRDYDIFCGMDVDKKSISAAFLDHDGMQRTLRMPYRAMNLLNYVRNQYPGKRVVYAYEAGPTGYGLYDSLTSQGNCCLVVSASNIPTARGQRVKTNRLDAQKIAENLRGGQLKSIHIPSEEYRGLRHLTQLRETFLKQATASKLRIKSLLLFEGIEFPESETSRYNNNWSREIIGKLKELKCNDVVRFKIDQLLTTLEYARFQVRQTSKEIRTFYSKHAELSSSIKYTMSISGIGKTTATELVARIGDWRLLERPNQIGAFFGLVPREHSTGDSVNRGSITRSGDSRLRNKLIQCAWTAIRHDEELLAFYSRIYKHHNPTIAKKVAIVAVARKLTLRIFAVLTQQRPYSVRTSKSLIGQMSGGRLAFAAEQ